jgi:hypothetical protein
MTTLIQSINSRIQEDVLSVNFGKENFERIEYLLQNRDKIVTRKSKFLEAFEEFIGSIVKIEIKDNTVYPSYHTNDFLGRKKQLIDLLTEAIEYNLLKGRNIPNVIMYFGTKDSHNFFEPELPIFVLSKPESEPGLLFPDNTFHNWEEDRIDILNNCKKIEKEPLIFFRGADTGNKKHNIRKILSKDRKLLHSKIIISKEKVPQYTFCKYKYLLNLPGTSAWSYRFKYLFLMKSLVINVALQYKRSDKGNLIKQSKWIQFFDQYFLPGEDYVEIKYYWGDSLTEREKRNNYIKTRDNILKIYNYYENNPEKYEKIVKSGYNKIKKITPEMVYNSIYKIIKNYHKNTKN